MNEKDLAIERITSAYERINKRVWILMDELIDALAVLNPKLLKNFYTKLSEIKG